MKLLFKICVLMYFVSIIIGCSSVNKTNVSSRTAVLPYKADHNYSVVQESSPKFFNDIGSAIKWRDDQCILHQSAFDREAKVFDCYDGKAIMVKEAVYVIHGMISTPGGHDTIALKDLENAEKFLSDNGTGKIITFDTLVVSEQ